MSRVTLMEEWPSISETTLGLTLLRSSAADARPDPPNFGKPACAPNHVQRRTDELRETPRGEDRSFTRLRAVVNKRGPSMLAPYAGVEGKETLR